MYYLKRSEPGMETGFWSESNTPGAVVTHSYRPSDKILVHLPQMTCIVKPAEVTISFLIGRK